jgi:lycopene cyclase domain-containing protein
LTYAGFLLAFLVPAILVLGAGLVGRRQISRRLLLALAVTAALAVLYTGPWDAAIIAQGVWTYPPGRVLGPAIAGVPVEEYAFFVLQVALTGLLTATFLAGRR